MGRRMSEIGELKIESDRAREHGAEPNGFWPTDFLFLLEETYRSTTAIEEN